MTPLLAAEAEEVWKRSIRAVASARAAALCGGKRVHMARMRRYSPLSNATSLAASTLPPILSLSGEGLLLWWAYLLLLLAQLFEGLLGVGGRCEFTGDEIIDGIWSVDSFVAVASSFILLCECASSIV